MKRILSTLTASAVILLILQVNLEAQEVKTEKKIKIIVDDGSGKKVIVDTIITDNSDIETISTPDGKIIWIGSEGQDHMEKGSKHVTVTVSSDGDSLTSEGNNNVTVWTEKGESSDVNKVIVIKEAKCTGTHPEKNYDVMVTTDDDSTVEKARYVVAKDGMVVTVEGEDEAKARELMKVIEEHMGVKEKEKKSETKKTSTK